MRSGTRRLTPAAIAGLGSFFGLIAVSSASEVLYNSYGFESSAGYVANEYLQGQPSGVSFSNQWVEVSSSSNNPPYPTAEVMTYPASTQQLVAVTDDNIGPTDYGAWYPQTYDSPNPAFTPSVVNGTNHVDISWTEAWLSGATGDPFFGIQVFNGDNSVALAGVDASNGLLVVQNNVDTSELGSDTFQGTAGTYYNFELDLNYSTQTYGVYIDNDLVDTANFATSDLTFTDADILTYALEATDATGEATDATGEGYFDNYLVTAVPEPGTLGIGSLALLVLHKRRSRGPAL